jgi:hypothetical protein
MNGTKFPTTVVNGLCDALLGLEQFGQDRVVQQLAPRVAPQ